MLIGPASTAEQREEFARKVEANPRGYIAQPTISLSQHPTFVDGRIEGRHVDLRPFVLYGERDQGPARRPDPRGPAQGEPGGQQLAGRRDQGHVGPPRAPRAPPAARGEAALTMLSRVAENLYWMSRYVERAENVARLLDVGFYLELDAAGSPSDGARARREHPDDPRLPRRLRPRPTATADRDAVLRFLTFDRKNAPLDPGHDRPSPRERPRHPGGRSAPRPGASSTSSTCTSPAPAPRGGSGPARRGSTRGSSGPASCSTA